MRAEIRRKRAAAPAFSQPLTTDWAGEQILRSAVDHRRGVEQLERNRLVDDGLVSSYGARFRLTLTPAGQTTLEQALTTLSDRFDTRLGGLEPQERDELQRLLEKLLQHAG